jgi:phosphopantetheinyl transferase (holo-ACP synthase)
LRLWTLWAAKEAAYKVRCKLEGGTRAFRPRDFSCELQVTIPEGEHQGARGLAERAADPMTIFRVEGRVLSERLQEEILVEGTSDGSFVHIVGWNIGPLCPGTRRLEVGLERLVPGGSDAGLEHMREHFTAEEWEGVHSLPSALVRLFARARLTSRLGGRNEAMPPPRVEILTGSARSAPRVRIAGRDCPELSVSLSHHGRYVAWAMLSRVSLDNLRARAGIA